MKVHQTNEGALLKCDAKTPDKCPLRINGEPAPHYATKAEGMAAIAASAARENKDNPLGTLSPKSSKVARVVTITNSHSSDNRYNNPFKPGENRSTIPKSEKVRFAKMGSALYEDKLTVDERRALRGYLSNAWFKKYSTALRSGATEEVALYAEKVETVRKVIKKYGHPEPITTFRYERFPNKSAMLGRLSNFELGATIVPGGLFSTTANAAYVGSKAMRYNNSIAFEVESSNGLNLCDDYHETKVKTLHPFPDEMEVLIDGNKEFEVISITQEYWRGAQVTTIKLREVN